MIEKLMIAMLLSASLCFYACAPDDLPETDQDTGNGIIRPPWLDDEDDEGHDPDGTPSYDNLEAYDYLKNYVDRTRYPNFKVGAAIFG